MRTGRHTPLVALLVLVACSHGLAARNGSADFAVDAYPVDGEMIQEPSTENVGMYHQVLRFYKPSGSSMRLLDRTLLPAARDQQQGGRIEASLAESMLSPMGKSFCVRDGQQVCNGCRRGGVLQVSPVYRSPDERVRIAVRYTSIEPYGPEVASTQVFQLERSEGTWVIRGRQ